MAGDGLDAVAVVPSSFIFKLKLCGFMDTQLKVCRKLSITVNYWGAATDALLRADLSSLSFCSRHGQEGEGDVFLSKD